MDEVYMTKMAAAFLDELSSIEKQAFVGGAAKFLGKGFSGIGGLMRGQGITAAAKGAGGHGALMKKIYQKGAGRVGAGGAPAGVMGGLKALGGSRYGQMAGAAAVPLAAGYALG